MCKRNRIFGFDKGIELTESLWHSFTVLNEPYEGRATYGDGAFQEFCSDQACSQVYKVAPAPVAKKYLSQSLFKPKSQLSSRCHPLLSHLFAVCCIMSKIAAKSLLLSFVSVCPLLAASIFAGGGVERGVRGLGPTPHYASLLKLRHTSPSNSSHAAPYNAGIRPTNQNTQLVIEVQFNNVPRYLLLDTGTADTWMTSPDFQCLDANRTAAPLSTCNLGDAYIGPPIPQIGNETYFQVYGNGERISGAFGYADVSIAGLKVKTQKVALGTQGYVLGDGVRSGVVGLAPQAVTRLFENTDATNSVPNGSVTTYDTVFERMYTEPRSGQRPIDPVFSLALERGDAGGYIAFGGLPPVNISHDFTATPFKAINYYGKRDPSRYYPIQPDGFHLNGAQHKTSYRVVVDSGTAINRLPLEIVEQVNRA